MAVIYPHGAWFPAVLRLIKTFLATGIAQALLVRPEWTNPEEATKALAVAFVSGVISAVFKYLREKGIVSRSLPL